jgi:hypothetical protein
VSLRIKEMLFVFIDDTVVAHYEFCLEGQKINQDFCLVVLRSLQNAVRRMGPEMWTAASWLLHHDNAPAHRSLPIRQLLAKHSIPTLPQPPIHLLSPLPSFFCSLNSKLSLKGEDF